MWLFVITRRSTLTLRSALFARVSKGEATSGGLHPSRRAFRAPQDEELTASRGLRLLAQPLPHPCIGVGVLGDVGNDSDGIGAGGENVGGLFELDAADRDQRDVADA